MPKEYRPLEKNSHETAWMKKKKPLRLRALRASTGLSQKDFWAAVSVSQATGSRYELGRGTASDALLRLIYSVYVMKLNIPPVVQMDL